MARSRWRSVLTDALVLCAVALGLGGASLRAQEPLPPVPAASTAAVAPATALDDTLARRGDLTLRKSTLEAALFTISELWKVNIVAANVEGEVNGVFKDAPLREILDSILLGNGYGYRVVGESIVIEELAKLGSVNPFFESAAVQLMNVKPSEVAQAVSVLSTPGGQVRPLDSASTLIVVDFPDRVRQIRELATKIDAASSGQLGALDANGLPRPLEVMYRHLQFITAIKASAALDSVLSDAGRVSILEGEDRLIIADYEVNLKMARAVLDQIDRPRPQVRISALIYDISLQDLEALGLNWNSNGKARIDAAGDPQTALEVDSITTLPFASGTTGGTVTLSNLSEHLDITAVLLAVQNASDARLLADPNVTVMDNEEASFSSVSEIPYQQLTQTGGGGQIGTTAFRDAGIKLTVRPKVSADGTIEMEVAPEFSRLTGFTPGDNQPIIDRRTASTRLRVANGQTVVIGGLRQRTDVGDFSGLPGLKDLRYVGRLFRSRQTDIRESELVVFVSPRIVGYAPPLNCREQLVADTIHGRLEHVPAAEGAPGCVTPLVPMMPPAQYDGMETLPAPVPTPAESSNSRLQYPANYVVAMAPPRRLPPVSLPRQDGVGVNAPPVDPNAPPRLRVDYDSRFRATGGINPREQRVAERPAPPTPVVEPRQQFWR